MAFNYSITVQQRSEARDTYGGPADTWATFATLWADVVTVSGSENFTSDMMVYNDVKKFVTHYEGAKSVTPKMRILYDSEYFYITSVNHKNRLLSEIIAFRSDDE